MKECLADDDFCRVAGDAVLLGQPWPIDIASLEKGNLVVDKNARHMWKGCEKDVCCAISDLSFRQDLG